MAALVQHPVEQRLPTSYATGIGRIISRWAYLKWLLAGITYKALGVNPKQGRIAVRETRADEYVTMIQNLLEIQKLAVSLPSTGFKKRLQDAESVRDHLAHGVWIRHAQTKELRLGLIKGKSPMTPGGASVSRKLAPEGIRMTPTDLAKHRREIDSLIAVVRQLEKSILRALASSRGTPP